MTSVTLTSQSFFSFSDFCCLSSCHPLFPSFSNLLRIRKLSGKKTVLRENELRINYSKSSFTFSTSAFAAAHASVTHSFASSFCLRINLLFKSKETKQV